MRFQALFLAFLLLAIVPSPTAAQAPPLVTPEEGDLATVFAFDAGIPERVGDDVLGSTTLASAWSASDAEIGNAATFAFESTGASIRVVTAQSPGGAWISQTLPLDARAYDLSVTQSGTGSLVGYRFIVRESGFPDGTRPLPYIDTTYEARPTADSTELRWRWWAQDPSSTAVTIFLRLQFAGGDNADVTFEDASFTPVTDVAWSFGDGTPTERGARVAHRFAAPGTFDVQSTVTHPGEAPRTQTARVTVENKAPTVTLDVARLGASARFRLDASSATDPDGVESRLRNPDFDAGAHDWELSTGEIGAEGSLEAQDGTLHLTTAAAARTGTVFAWQRVPIIPDRALRFDVNVSDDNGIERYEFLLRESGSASGRYDHVLSHAPVGANWTQVGFNFAPRYADSTAIIVHLRAVVPAGVAADVRFDDVALRDGLRFSWRIDGAPLVSRQPIEDVALGAGLHRVNLTVTDVAGATASVERVINGTLPKAAPRAGIVAPVFALLHESTVFRGAPSRPSAATEGIIDGVFADGLTAWRTVSPADAVVTTADGLALVTAPTNADAPAELQQRVPVASGTPYEFHATLRAAAPDARADVVFRELVVDADGRESTLRETFEPLAVTPAWQEARARWNPQDELATHLLVMLRVHEGSVEATNVSFAPLKNYRWRFDVTPTSSQPIDGYGVRHFFTKPGLALVTLEVTDAAGATNGTSALVPVLNASTFEARPNIAGGIHVAMPNVPLHPEFAAFEITRRDAAGDARTTTLAPAASLAFDDADPTAGAAYSYEFSIVTRNGTRATVATANATLQAGAPLGVVRAPDTVARFASADVTVVAPADAVDVQATLHWGPIPWGRVELARDLAQAGRWVGTYEPGFFTPPGTLRLDVVALAADGTATPVGVATSIDVTLAENGAWSLWLMLAAAALALVAWSVRKLRQTGRLAWPDDTATNEDEEVT